MRHHHRPADRQSQHLPRKTPHRTSATRRKPEYVSPSTYLCLRSLCVSCRVGPLSQPENTAHPGQESSRDASGRLGRLSHPSLIVLRRKPGPFRLRRAAASLLRAEHVLQRCRRPPFNPPDCPAFQSAALPRTGTTSHPASDTCSRRKRERIRESRCSRALRC
jgi:hypothetical protein